MQCPHCDPPDSIRNGTIVSHATVAKPADGLSKLRRGKDQALKQQACQLFLEGRGMRTFEQFLCIQYEAFCCCLVQAAGDHPPSQS